LTSVAPRSRLQGAPWGGAVRTSFQRGEIKMAALPVAEPSILGGTAALI
jgi:hypothetical protein